MSAPPSNGHKHALHFKHPPKRIVSLVPSVTESLFELGLGETVVGITDFCNFPPGELGGIQRVGGPKNPRQRDILALHPDLVIANWEENTRQSVESLEAADIPVWVTFPRSVQESMDVLWTLVGLFQSQAAAKRLDTLETTLNWMRASVSEQKRVRYFCPIWHGQNRAGRQWWMTFNRHTYCHDLLATIGGENVFADRERHYPLSADLGMQKPVDPKGRDTRYPHVIFEEINSKAPEVILLPNEPFAFNEAHRASLEFVLEETPAVKNERVYLVDGSLITWHGTRLGRALRDLPQYFQEKNEDTWVE
jgi:iron complex transport system substrate-binding protein